MKKWHMEKWHMEEIVTAVGRSASKLELPEQSWKIRWAPISPERSGSSPSVVRSMRSRASRILHFLK